MVLNAKITDPKYLWVILEHNFDSTKYWAKGQASPSMVMLSSMENSILKGVMVSICCQEGKTNFEIH